MDSPHAWVTTAIGQYLLLVWGATSVGGLVLVVLPAVWARYFPRRAGATAPGAGYDSERIMAASALRPDAAVSLAG